MSEFEDHQDEAEDTVEAGESVRAAAPERPGKPQGNPRNLRPSSGAKGRPPEGKAPSSAETKGVGAVMVRNEFYRDGYRALQKAVVIQGIAILGLIAAMMFVIQVHQPENRYFATTEDGRLVPMLPLSEPNLTTPALMSWAAQSATEVMTFGFNDYRRRLQEGSRNFTRHGWESFTTALEKAKIIDIVETNKNVVTAAPRSAPVVREEKVVMGRYQWVVEMPLTVTFQAGSTQRSENYIVRLVIVRVHRLESPNGVGIEQWLSFPG